jgi:ElaA protein
MLSWRFASFDKLTPLEVHDVYRARIAVFVLEQECPFQDVDGYDPGSWHLLGRDATGELLAYARILPPGAKYPEPSIGRVLTTANGRGKGLGRVLVREAVARTEALYPGRPIRIGAQQRLDRFYRELGFEPSSDPYMEDGIPHIEMLRTAPKNEHA